MAAPSLGTPQITETAARRWTMVILLWLAVLINYIDRGGLSVIAVPLMKEFHLSPTATGTLLSSFFWSYSLMQIPAGYLIDRFGLKWTYAGAFVLWSAGSALSGLTGSFASLLACRVVLGAGEAAAQPASLSYIRRSFSASERGLPTGFYLTGMDLGPAAGTFFGSLLLGWLGWRGMLVGLGLGCCVWLVPWLLIAPSGKNAGPRDVSSFNPTDEPSHPRAQVPWALLLSMPLVWGIIVGGFLYSYYWYFCLTWLPSYLVMDRKMSLLQMGAFGSLPFLAKIPVVMFAGRFSDSLVRRTGREVLVRKSFIACGFTIASSILLLLVVKSQTAVLAVLIVSLCGMAVGSANYWALTQAITPAAMTGRVIGAQNMIGNLAGACAPIVTGWLVTRTKDFSAAIWFAGGALLIAASCYVVIVSEKRGQNLRLDLAASSAFE
jgi:MFS family permease